MSDLIVRVYETEQQAKGVVKKLKDAGFADDAIVQLAPEPATEGEEGAPKKSRPVGAGQLADFYAEQLQQGRSLVGVRAAFGEGRRATNILESGKPLAIELPQAPEAAKVRAAPIAGADDFSDATPLSRALNLAVLRRNSSAPLSDYMNWPVTSKKRHYLTTELADPHKAFSASFMPLLSSIAAPFSSKVGMRVLSDNATPLSNKANMDVLKDDPTPLSSKFNLRVLSDNPTPLSSMLGMKVLSENS